MKQGSSAFTPVDELKRALQALGFTDHEARAYIALNEAPDPATAYEVAQRSGIPKANAYSVLASLASKGAVQEVMRDPVRYAPVNASEFFRLKANRTTDLCERVAQLLKERAPDEDQIYVWAYRGQSQVDTKLAELIDSSKQRIWIKGPITMLDHFREPLKRAAERGVRVMLIVFGDDVTPLTAHKNITVFLHEGRGTNRGASNVVVTATVDSESFMIASYTDEVHASFGRNPSIIYVVETMITHEIYLAEMYGALGPMLDDVFGENLDKLRAKYRPPQMGMNLLVAGSPQSVVKGKPNSRRPASAGSRRKS